MVLYVRRTFLLASVATAVFATPVQAVDAAAADLPAPVSEDAEIVVFGRGKARQVQDVRADAIALTTPVTTRTSSASGWTACPSATYRTATPTGCISAA